MYINRLQQARIIGLHIPMICRQSIALTVVEWATHMLMYTGPSPTSVDHHEELIQASYCSPSELK